MRRPPIRLVAGIGLLLAFQHSHSQDILWEKSYGGRHAEYLCDVQPTADYGFILAGSSLSKKTGNKGDAGSGDLDYWIWKMDEHGEPDWQKSIGGGGTDMLKSIRGTHDGGFLLGGTSNSMKGLQKKEDSRGGNDYWVVKLDARGEEMWQRTLGGRGQDDLLGVAPTRDGGYLLAGSSDSDFIKGDKVRQDKKEASRGNMDYWIIKLDSEGNELWQRTYGGEYADLLRSMEVTRDGGFILGGYSNSGQSGEKGQVNFGVGGDYWILKLDEKGGMEWQQTIGGDQDDQLQVVHQTHDGGYIVAGNSNSGTSNSKSRPNGNGTDFWVVKLDADGVIDWQETYDFGQVDVLTSLVENRDHSFLIGGHSPVGDQEGAGDFIALKISEKGERLWDRNVGSGGEDVLRKAIETRDGGYLMAGTSDPTKIRRSTRKGKYGGLSPLDNSRQLKGLENAEKAIDDRVDHAVSQTNAFLDEKSTAVTDGINDALGGNGDSAFKAGLNKPQMGVGANKGSGPSGNTGGLKPSGGLLGGEDQKPALPPSGEKRMNYGGKDFWVVKLKDRQKPEHEKVKMEAIPNPVVSYTNVIVGFDFTSGTARVYDIGGRELQKFAVDSRTVPVNLSDYPAGVYIVNVSTNNGEGSVKVIKNQ